MIGTDTCYGLFERGNKTVQAKNIKFCVGGPSCVGGGENHLHQYTTKYTSKNRSLAPPGHNLCLCDRTCQAESEYMHKCVFKCSLAPLAAKNRITRIFIFRH